MAIPPHYTTFLEKVLTPARLTHSLGVMQVMGELAEIYHFDRDQALTAGLLHDAAKDLPLEKQQELITAGNIQVNEECENNYLLYMHGPVGALLVQQELGIRDELVLGAIDAHCYFGENPYFDHPLSWCLRFADLLEPNRNWTEAEIILNCVRHTREWVYAGEMKKAAFLQTGSLIKFYEVKNLPIHPGMRSIYESLGEELGLDDMFLKEALNMDLHR